MKTVQYQGQTFEVPDWVTFIAADPAIENELPIVYAYQYEPTMVIGGGWDSPGASRNLGILKLTTHYPAQEIK